MDMDDRPITPVPETPPATAAADVPEHSRPLPEPLSAPVTHEPEAKGASVAPHATGSAIPPEELERLTADIVAALKTVYDPEIPADIYELGLIYRVDIDDDRNIEIDMTLTAPGCPVAGEMPGWVENAVSLVPGVGNVNVSMVFDPPWTPERMSDEARVALDWY
jgi:FeS assembly SUF system protein